MEAKKVRVLVRYKPGVLDPQGRTIGSILKSMGYHQVQAVHAGKVYELEWSGDEKSLVREIAEKVLSNPLIEEYEIQWPDGDSAS